MRTIPTVRTAAAAVTTTGTAIAAEAAAAVRRTAEATALKSLIVTAIKILAEAEPETDYAIRYDGKTLAIDCEKGGAYTIVFASYDTGGKMTTVKTLTAELNAGVNSDVKIPEDVALEAGDKIFLWENLKTLRPLCSAYTVNK